MHNFWQLGVLLLLFSSSLFSQVNAIDGALEGYVLDPAGSAVPRATVVVRNLNTNATESSHTNEDGYFRFPILRVGQYTLTAEAAGFARYEQTGIRIMVGSQIRTSVTLALASVVEATTVQADASIVESSTPAVGGVVTEHEVRSLPITSRNVYNLFLLNPGTKGVQSPAFGTTQFSFGGLQRSTWYTDGLDNSSRRGGRQIRLVITTPEAVEEVQVLSNGYTAEFGRSAGGIVSLITRSGTNNFHGAFLLLNRPSAASATPGLTHTRVDSSWEDYAFTFSGPILRNRLFFFTNFEYNPYVLPRPVTILAANAQRVGLRPSQLGSVPYGETFQTPSGKLSYRLNDRNTGFLRYNRFTNDEDYNGFGGLTAADRNLVMRDRMNSGAGQLTSVLSPNTVNEFRFGFINRDQTFEPMSPAAPTDSFIDITGIANFGRNPLSGSRAIEASTEFIDNLTWSRGRHTIKAGFDFQTTSYDLLSAQQRTFQFQGYPASRVGGAVSALDQYLNTIAGKIDPATAIPFTYSQLLVSQGNPQASARFNFINGFVQDEIRLRPNLSLQAGLRYERILFPEMDQDSPHTLSRRAPGNGLNFAPRLSLTWSPSQNGKSVIRAAGGMFYDTPSLGLATDAIQLNGKRLLSYTIPGTDLTAPVFPNLPATVDARFAAKTNISPFSPDFRILMSYQGNLQVERAITSDVSVKMQYQYLASRFGPYKRDINLPTPVSFLADGRPVYQGNQNRPDQRFNAINLIESGSNSVYHGLDITFSQRLVKGLQWSTNYSWSHGIADTDQDGAILPDPSNRRRGRGDFSSDLRHYLTFRIVYEPLFSSSALRILNGFGLAGIGAWNSGYPINASSGADLNNDQVNNDRPLFMGRNAFRAPDYIELGLRLTRTITLRERLRLQLIAEGENVLNKLNADCGTGGCSGSVVNNYNNADFLRVTTARPPRRLQFGLRFSF